MHIATCMSKNILRFGEVGSKTSMFFWCTLLPACRKISCGLVKLVVKLECFFFFFFFFFVYLTFYPVIAAFYCFRVKHKCANIKLHFPSGSFHNKVFLFASLYGMGHDKANIMTYVSNCESDNQINMCVRAIWSESFVWVVLFSDIRACCSETSLSAHVIRWLRLGRVNNFI